MKYKNPKYRKIFDKFIMVLSLVAAGFGIFCLFWILYIVFQHGYKTINWDFFVNGPDYFDLEKYGVQHAIRGTFLITLFATFIGVPLGLLGGIYLSEFSRGHWAGRIVRFSANVLMGTPSIVVGVFVYSVVIFYTKQHSGFAGAISLAIIMFPVVLTTAEDMLSLVPHSLREAALALGTPYWKMVFSILFRAAKSGLMTAIMLAIARVSGETAPLLFTAMNSDFMIKLINIEEFFNSPLANLTVTVNDLVGNEADIRLLPIAWGASLFITVAVLVLNIFAKTVFRSKTHGTR